MNALERLRAVLCAPDGEVVIDGTDADRSIVTEALKELDAALSQTSGVPEEPDWRYTAVSALEYINAGDAENAASMLRSAIDLSSAAPAASGGEGVHRVTDAQIADIVLRWEANQFDSFSAMRAIKQHLEKCALQPANDYNLGWVAGHRAAPQPPAGASQSSNPNPVTPGLSSESGASVSERARALLAAEYERANFPDVARTIREGGYHWDSIRALELRAIEQALAQQRGSEPCLYVKPRLVEILHKLGPAQTEHRVMVSTVPDAQYTVCLSTTPQPGAEALREAVSWSVLQIGNRGAAYDPPCSRRAYTYQHQPGNLDAHRLGGALATAADATHGDNIDRGLSLLKALEYVGFGVFQIGVPTHQPCADSVRGLAQRWRQEAEDNKHLGGSWHKTDLCNTHADELESLLARGG